MIRIILCCICGNKETCKKKLNQLNKYGKRNEERKNKTGKRTKVNVASDTTIKAKRTNHYPNLLLLLFWSENVIGKLEMKCYDECCCYCCCVFAMTIQNRSVFVLHLAFIILTLKPSLFKHKTINRKWAKKTTRIIHGKHKMIRVN